MTEKTVEQANAKAQAQAEAVEQAQDEAEVQAQAVEAAWAVLVQAGILTLEDRKVLEGRAKDRQLLALASETLAKGKDLGVVAVAVSTATMTYTAEEGCPPRYFPRMSAPRQRSKSEGEKPKGKDENAGDGEIPTEYLKKACQQLNIKWYGRAAALKSKRVIALARQLAVAAVA